MSEERTSQEAQRASVDHFRKEHTTPPEVSVDEVAREIWENVSRIVVGDGLIPPAFDQILSRPRHEATLRILRHAARRVIALTPVVHYHFYCPEGSTLFAMGSVVSIVPALMPIKPKCGAVPIDPEREAACAEPFHWDDGVPYCDTCGLYRNSKHRGQRT